MPPAVQIFFAWCLLLPAFCGVGFAASRLIPGPDERIGWPLAFWLGLAVTAALLAVWHLALPVDGRAWLLLAPLGALGLLLERRDAARLLGQRAAFGLGLAVFAFWVATRAALPGFTFDDGLYYTQTVRWNSLYAAVPGLGNLHAFLAYNHGFHLLVAALGVGPFHLRGAHLANGLLVVAAMAPCASALLRVLDPRQRPTAADSFAALLLGGVLDASLAADLPTPSADRAMSLVGAGLLICALGPALRGARPGMRRAGAVIAACGGALVLKPSILCIAAPMALFAAAHWLRTGPQRWERAQLGTFTALAALAFAVPGVLHSIVLSGYPLFPSPVLSLQVDWRMDQAVVVNHYHWIYAFARWAGHSYEEVTASAAWVPRWFGGEWLNNRVFLLPATLGACSAMVLVLAAAKRRRPPFALTAAAGAALLGVAIWWGSAPDTRFAGPLLWASAGLLALGAAAAFRPALDGPARAGLAAGVIAVGAGAFLPSPPLFVWPRELPPLVHDVAPPTALLRSGERVPVSTSNRCWDPPCALAPVDPRLRLRKPGDWASGFTVAPLPPGSAPAPR